MELWPDVASFLGGVVVAAGFHLLASRSANNTNAIDLARTKGECNDEIKHELFSRVSPFFGSDNFSDLENSFVIVVGLGGVGSHCANMLIRSGVRKMRVIDFDQVTLSSLNRHAVANMKDVGLSKAEVMCRHFRNIVPWCEIEACAEMF
ncbi:TCD2, partial [Symbiodinium microadriaticum]